MNKRYLAEYQGNNVEFEANEVEHSELGDRIFRDKDGLLTAIIPSKWVIVLMDNE